MPLDQLSDPETLNDFRADSDDSHGAVIANRRLT
jgi:hypothetical protein